MKKKLLLLLILVISMIGLIATMFVIKLNASLGGVSYFVSFAHKKYDNVKDIAFDPDASLTDETSDQWMKCDQVMCVENSDTNGGAGKLIAIIDINPDGSNPASGTIQTASGTSTLPENVLNKKLAAFSYYVENKSVHDYSSNTFNAAKNPFVGGIWEGGGYRKYIQDSTGINLPSSSEAGLTSGNALEFANDYANDSNPSVTYSARIFVFRSGGMQARLVLFGKESEPTVTVNKYITKVTNDGSQNFNPDGTLNEEIIIEGDIYNSTERKDLDITKKKSKPVDVVLNGSVITYTVTLTNSANVAITGTYKDEYDSAFTKVSGIFSETVTLQPGETKTYTVVLQLPTANNGTIYENKASFNSSFDCDYVSITVEPPPEETTEEEPPPTGSYEKYITKVTKPDGTSTTYNRTGRSSDDKKTDPVTVEKGDKVTYEIKFTNTSSHDLNWLEFTDTMESGLSYSGGSTFTKNYGKISGGRSITETFTVEVTESNMSLRRLENKCYNFNGEWTKVITHKYICYHQTYSHIKKWYEYKDISISFSSNMGADYVKLDDPEIGGMVWLDTNKDGLRNSEDGFESIPVRLVDISNGQVVATTNTDSNGDYTFGRVQKGVTRVYNDNGNFYYDESAGWKSYYVLFDYFGERYIATTDSGTSNLNSDGSMNANFPIDSNGSEVDRTGFNNSLETIAYNKAYASKDASGSTKDLEYDKNGHESTLKWTDSTTMRSKSFDLYFIHDGETEYLKHINLGLYEREKADLSLKKDVVKADISINGYSATYNYESLGSDGYTGEYKLQKPYRLSLYAADYKFRVANYTTEAQSLKNVADELNIVLTYKITVTNESSTTLYGALREVIDISSDTLTINSANTEDGTSLNISDSSTYNETNKYSYSGYQAHFLTGFNDVIGIGETKSIYITYTVNKDADGGVILGEKANIAQIGAFSIYEDESQSTPAGFVDIDSNPGVVNTDEIGDPSDDTLYEDNSYYTSIIIQLRPDTEPGDPPPPPPDDPPGGDPNYDIARKITGNVWEDLNTETLSSGQKVGDGKKDNENGAEKVTVVLLEVLEKDGKEYLVDTGITTETDANGDYTLKDVDKLHAGQYVVRFIYGDDPSEFVTDTGDTIRFSGQDYKSTVYTPVGLDNDENEVVEVTAFRDTKANSGAQVSVAKDNELRRLEVIDFSTTMTYVKDTILKAYESENFAKLAENTSMFADTKKFNMQVEDPGNTTVTLEGKHEDASGLVTYRYVVNEVNFGLIERPITKLELMDDIKEIVAVTSSGDELLHIYFDITYELNPTTDRVERKLALNTTLSKGYENVQLLDRNNTTKGFRYVNIDSDLLQGMRITIKYQFAIANIGDIDTSNQNLIDMVKNYDVGNVANLLGTSIPDTQYTYGNTGSGVENKLLKNYTYNNLGNAVDNLKSDGTYNKYKTVVSNALNDKDYELGYFLGNTYYKDYNSPTDKIVETRTDQILSYVDNDLVFKPSENQNPVGNETFLNYTLDDIRDRELLKDITDAISDDEAREILSDIDGVSYITDDKNNLAFNIEDNAINNELYRFLTPIKNITDVERDKLYVIELEASRILASQLDVEDVAIDNLTEIVKITNTVGRKTYIEFNGTKTANAKTGYLGNTPDVVNDPDYDIVQGKEIDTNFTETVTFSPPTGLTLKEQKAEKISNKIVVFAVIGGIILIAGSSTLYLITKKKFYK